MNSNNKSKIKAVFDDDLEMLLNELGVLSKFKHGKMKCFFCSIAINNNNLHSIFPDSGAVKFAVIIQIV